MIVFVIGGTTYSEIRSAYEIGETYNRDVFIGSTEILRPKTFIEHLGHLQLPVPSPQSMIAPYVAPAPPPQIQRNDSSASKTASLMSHMHITSPSALSNKSSSVSLDKMSIGSTTPEEPVEKKKKKKGLAARLFG